jgi:Predicted membrane protein
MWHELFTILLAMAPTIEAHGAIATGIAFFKFSPLKAFTLSVIGTLTIIPFIIFFLHKVSHLLMQRIYLMNRFLTWLFSYTRRRHAKRFSEGVVIEGEESGKSRFWKAFALFAFVAFPGPLTGVWGGALAAFVFGIAFWDSIIALALGAVIVAAIDAAIIGGILSFIK